MRHRILAVLAAVILTLGLAAPANAEVGNSGDNSCTTSNLTGDVNDGSWTRTYEPGCTGTTVGSITITWHDYYVPNTNHQVRMVWSAEVYAGAIAGNDCIYVALDWNNPNPGGHSDSQWVRNCYENSTYNPASLPQTITTTVPTLRNPSLWPVQKLQIGTYDPDSGHVTGVVCPSASNAPAGTDTDGECLDFNSVANGGAPNWSDTFAKIYRKANDGTTDNNNPPYPSVYDYGYQIDPFH